MTERTRARIAHGALPRVPIGVALLLALLLLLLACDSPKTAPQKSTDMASSSSSSAPKAAPPVGSMSLAIPFCAFGGNGVVPADASPDDFYRVLAWAVVGANTDVSGLEVRALEISGDGGVEATMKRIESVERLDPKASLETPAVWQSRGKPFDGKLAPGETRLRIEAWITKRPRSRPAILRLALGAGAAQASATCKLEIEWPTG